MAKSFTKKLLIVLVLLLSLTACGGSDESKNISSDTNNSSETIEARTAIIFEILEGAGVTLNRNNETEEVYEGMRLSADDSIITDDVSSVYIRIDDDKNVLLNSNSKITISEMKSGSLKLSLDYGEFFFNVENKLSDDESMEFSIGSTSMSIRGTSGAGKLVDDGNASFAIYTGKGEVKDELQEEVSYELIPNTIVKFNVEDQTLSNYETATLNTVTEDDISGLLDTYLDKNDDYSNELENNGWVTGDEGMVPDQDAIDAQMSKTDGWNKNEDGSFTHTEEKKEEVVSDTKQTTTNQTTNNTSSKTNDSTSTTGQTSGGTTVSITKIAKPSKIDANEKSTYDGTVKSIVSGYDSSTMSALGTVSASDAGEYSCSISPKAGYAWSDGTTSDISFTWSIDPITIAITGDYKKGVVKTANGSTKYEEKYIGTTNPTITSSDVQIWQVATTSSADANVSDDESYVATNAFEVRGTGASNYVIDSSTYASTIIVHISKAGN